MPPRILFACHFPDSLWIFRGLHGVGSAQSPTGLARIADLAPLEFSVALVEENVEPIDDDHNCNALAISCSNVQYTRPTDEVRRCAKPAVDALAPAKRGVPAA